MIDYILFQGSDSSNFSIHPEFLWCLMKVAVLMIFALMHTILQCYLIRTFLSNDATLQPLSKDAFLHWDTRGLLVDRQVFD